MGYCVVITTINMSIDTIMAMKNMSMSTVMTKNISMNTIVVTKTNNFFWSPHVMIGLS